MTQVLGAAPHRGERDFTDVDGRQRDELAFAVAVRGHVDHRDVRRAPVVPPVAGADGKRARHGARAARTRPILPATHRARLPMAPRTFQRNGR